MAVISLTDASFTQEVLESSSLVLVDFWAPWCGPCKMIAPVLDDLAGHNTSNAKITKINIDDEPQTADNYGVRSIPTLMLFKDGEAVDTKVGIQSKGQIEAWMKGFV